jgi:hypothetical protein
MTKFMPADSRLTEARQPPLKDQYDEWLARIICYAFSVPASAFVSQVNRAISETLRQQATREGLIPAQDVGQERAQPCVSARGRHPRSPRISGPKNKKRTFS